MDEKFMVIKQESLSKEKKRKKNRKRFGIAAAVCLVAAIIGGWYLGWGRYFGVREENAVQIPAAAGQEIIYAALTSVKGNEITYVVAQEAQTADEETAQDGGVPQMEEGELPQGGEFSETDGGVSQMEEGELPQGGEFPETDGRMSQMEEGELPQGGEFPETDGGVPQMGEGELPQAGELSRSDGMSQGERGMRELSGRDEMSGFMERNFPNGSADSTDNFTYNNVTYELTDETVTTMIPVGTDVTTKLGTVTTFSRLAAGDRIALVVEEQDSGQIIVAVYIIG